MKEFTAHNRDDVVEQLPFIKKRFLTYADFGKASFDKLFTAEELKNSIKYTANYLISSFVRNNGNGNFSLEPLPACCAVLCHQCHGSWMISIKMETLTFA